MKKIFTILLFAIVLGLTGCTMNVAPQVELPQNKVEWISNSNRAATTTLDYVTLEIYKVPKRDGKFIHDEKEYLETKTLRRGEVLTFPSMKDYDYKYITAIRVVEFNSYNSFYAAKNEINFFDYENTIGLEQVHYYGGPIEKVENGEGWRLIGDSVYFRDETNGYVNIYKFLDRKVVAKFYNEYKDGGMIVWNN